MRSSNYSLKSICFSQIIQTINNGGNVDLRGLPPHLAKEIITQIHSAKNLTRVQEFNSESPHLTPFFEESWKIIIREKYFQSSSLPNLPTGKTWAEYYQERIQKEEEEDEMMRKLVEEAPKDKKKSKVIPKGTKVILQQNRARYQTSNLTPAMKRIMKRVSNK